MPPDREVAEWEARPMARIIDAVVGQPKTAICPAVARFSEEDRRRLDLAPGALCSLVDGHHGPHLDNIDGVYWEPEQ